MYAFKSGAGFEAENFAHPAREKAAEFHDETVKLVFLEFGSRATKILAKKVLRFQRVESGEKKEKLEYMHGNPVKNGLVKHPRDWIWSSFPFYGKDEAGLVRIDPVE